MVFLAGGVLAPGQRAFDVSGCGDCVVALVQIRVSGVIMINDIGCSVIGELGRAVVLVIFGRNAIGAIVRVVDPLVFGVNGIGQVGGVIIGKLHHSPVRIIHRS